MEKTSSPARGGRHRGWSDVPHQGWEAEGVVGHQLAAIPSDPGSAYTGIPVHQPDVKEEDAARSSFDSAAAHAQDER